MVVEVEEDAHQEETEDEDPELDPDLEEVHAIIQITIHKVLLLLSGINRPGV